MLDFKRDWTSCSYLEKRLTYFCSSTDSLLEQDCRARWLSAFKSSFLHSLNSTSTQGGSCMFSVFCLTASSFPQLFIVALPLGVGQKNIIPKKRLQSTWKGSLKKGSITSGLTCGMETPVLCSASAVSVRATKLMEQLGDERVLSPVLPLCASWHPV